MAKYEKVTCKECGDVFERDTGFFAKQPKSAGFLGLGYQCRSCTNNQERKNAEERDAAFRRQRTSARSDEEPGQANSGGDDYIAEHLKEDFVTRLLISMFTFMIFSGLTYGLYWVFKNSTSLIWEIVLIAGIAFSTVASLFSLILIPKRILATFAILLILFFVLR
jgi:hypothetical protein